jgi:hypothetical protein
LPQIQIQREAKQSFPLFISQQIGETKTLEILPLYEALFQPPFQGGMGVSYQDIIALASVLD